jgi:diguanylate cyclase
MFVRALTNLLLLPVIVVACVTPGAIRPGSYPVVAAIAVCACTNVALVLRFREFDTRVYGLIAVLGTAAITASSLVLTDPAAAQVVLGILAVVTTNVAVSFSPRVAAITVAICLAIGIVVTTVRAQSFVTGAMTIWVFAIILAVPTATVVRLRQLLSSAEYRASLDPLTGLLNRRGLLTEFTAIASRAASAGRTIAALVIDVDHFKDFNDREGHAAGDILLRRLADTVKVTASDSAAVARIGGEEFVVILDADLVTAEGEAERIRRTIQTVSNHEGLTVSIGVTVSAVNSDDVHGATLYRLIDLADRLMYRAKNAGRNTVVAAGAGF